MQFVKTPMLTLTLALAGGMFLALDAAPGEPNPPCNPVSGTSETAVGNTPAVLEGSATLEFGGETFEFALTVFPIGEVVEGDDGTLHVPTTHIFTLDQSSITTTDKAVLDPLDEPGLFTVNSRLKVTSGTGLFEGVTGRLHAHGEIDLFDEANGIEFPFFGEASLEYHGVICD